MSLSEIQSKTSRHHLKGASCFGLVYFLLVFLGLAAVCADAFRKATFQRSVHSTAIRWDARRRSGGLLLCAEKNESLEENADQRVGRSRGKLVPKRKDIPPLPPHIPRKFIYARLPERIKRLYTRAPVSEEKDSDKSRKWVAEDAFNSFEKAVDAARPLTDYPWPLGSFLRVKLKASRKDDLLESLRRFEDAVRGANKLICKELNGPRGTAEEGDEIAEEEKQGRFPALLLSVSALPTHRRVLTLLKSPFKDKDSREQFQLLTRKLLLDVHLTPMLLRHLEIQRTKLREKCTGLSDEDAPFERLSKLRSLTNLAKKRLKHSLLPESSDLSVNDELPPRRKTITLAPSPMLTERTVFEELEKLPLSEARKAAEALNIVRLPSFILRVTLPDRVRTENSFELYVHPEKLNQAWRRAEMERRWLSKFAKYKREQPIKDAIVQELLSPSLRRHFQLRWPQSVWALRSRTAEELEKMLRIARQSLASSKAVLERGEPPFVPKRQVFADFLPLHEEDDGRHFMAGEAKLLESSRFPLRVEDESMQGTQRESRSVGLARRSSGGQRRERPLRLS